MGYRDDDKQIKKLLADISRNTRIDYKELAHELIKAQDEVERLKAKKAPEAHVVKTKKEKNKYFWDVMLRRTKNITDEKMTENVVSMLAGLLFYVLGWGLLLAGIIVLAVAIYKCVGCTSLFAGFESIVLGLLVALVLYMFSAIFARASKEISITKDRNYAVNVLAATSGLAALIVSIIALVVAIRK